MANRIENVISDYHNLRNTNYNDIAREDLVAILKIVLYLNKFDITEAKAGIVNFLSAMRNNYANGITDDIKRLGGDEEVLNNSAAIAAGISTEILEKSLYFSESGRLIDNFLANYVPVWINSNTRKNPNYNPTVENIVELFNQHVEYSSRIKNNAIDKDVSADVVVPSVNTVEINDKYDRLIKTIVDNPKIPEARKQIMISQRNADRAAELMPVGPLYSNINDVLADPENGYRSPEKVPLGHDLAFLHTRLPKKYINILNYIQATMDPRTYAERKDLPYIDEYSGIVDYLLMTSKGEKDNTMELLMNAIQDNNYSNLKNSGIFVNGRYDYSQIYDKDSLLRQILATYVMWNHIEKSYACEVDYNMAILNHKVDSNDVLVTLQSKSLGNLYTPELTYIASHKPKFLNFLISEPKYSQLLHSITGYDFSILLSKFSKVSEIDMMLDTYENSLKEIGLDEYVTFTIFIKGYINYFNVLPFSKEDFEQLYSIVKCVSANDLEYVSGQFQNANKNNGVEVLNNWIKDKISYLSKEEVDKCKELDPEMLRSEDEKLNLVDRLVVYLIKLNKLEANVDTDVRNSLSIDKQLDLLIKDLKSNKVIFSINERLQILNNPKLIQLNSRGFNKVSVFLSQLGFSDNELDAFAFRKDKNILINGLLYSYPDRYKSILDSLENSNLSEDFELNETIVLYIPQKRLHDVIGVINETDYPISNGLLFSTLRCNSSIEELHKIFALLEKYHITRQECIEKIFNFSSLDVFLDQVLEELKTKGLENYVDYFFASDDPDELLELFIYLKENDLLDFADYAIVYADSKNNINDLKETIKLLLNAGFVDFFPEQHFTLNDLKERIKLLEEFKPDININDSKYAGNLTEINNTMFISYLFDFTVPVSDIQRFVSIVKECGLKYFSLLYSSYKKLGYEFEIIARFELYKKLGIKSEKVLKTLMNPDDTFIHLTDAVNALVRENFPEDPDLVAEIIENVDPNALSMNDNSLYEIFGIKYRFLQFQIKKQKENNENTYADVDLKKIGLTDEEIETLQISEDELKYKLSIIEKFKITNKKVILDILYCHLKYIDGILEKYKYIADKYEVGLSDLLNALDYNEFSLLDHYSLEQVQSIVDECLANDTDPITVLRENRVIDYKAFLFDDDSIRASLKK